MIISSFRHQTSGRALVLQTLGAKSSKVQFERFTSKEKDRKPEEWLACASGYKHIYPSYSKPKGIDW